MLLSLAKFLHCYTLPCSAQCFLSRVQGAIGIVDQYKLSFSIPMFCLLVAPQAMSVQDVLFCPLFPVFTQALQCHSGTSLSLCWYVIADIFDLDLYHPPVLFCPVSLSFYPHLCVWFFLLCVCLC